MALCRNWSQVIHGFAATVLHVLECTNYGKDSEITKENL